VREITEDLRCELTEEETRDRALQMTAAMNRLDELKAEKASTMKTYAEDINGLENTMRTLGKAVRSGIEYRAVICGVEFHMPVTGTKRITRLDTGELVREEAMTSFEMQENLFQDPGKVN